MNECEEFICDILVIERFSFTWRIPEFPVISLKFTSASFQKDNQVFNGVVKTSDLPNLCSGKFKCTSHCQIVVNDKIYTVLWKLEKIDEEAEKPERDSHTLMTDDENAEKTHCLPFKVMGTCYSSDRQNSLEEAYQYLEEYNRPVFVKLAPEPENAYDKHAIAVYIMSSSNYEKVGYIATELTRYIHPIIKDPDFDVTINKIRFCTTFQKIGFYLTLDITKKGQWDKRVINSSKSVK